MACSLSAAPFNESRLWPSINPETHPIYVDADNGDYTVDNCYAEELIAGVESLQVRWGENLNPADDVWAPDQYYIADDVGQWANVISAEVTLLLRSDFRFDRDPDTRTYGGSTADVVLDPDLDNANNTVINDPAVTSGDENDEDYRDRFRLRMVFRTVIELRNKTLVN